MDVAVRLDGVVKTYGSTRALDEIDLTVRRGEVHGFLGPNGAGKTTALRVLLGLARTDGGTATLLGSDPWRDAVELHRHLAYVPGDVALWPNLTGGETIDLLGRLRGGMDPARRSALMERFSLDPTKKTRSYSKGNRQKVALVAALASDVELLLLDEPTSGLDPAQRIEIRNLIHELSLGDDRTVMLSTHVLAEIEAICNRVIIIHKGRIVAQSDLAALAGGAGKLVRLEVARPDGLLATLKKLPGVQSAEQEGPRFTVSGDADLREAVAAAAVPAGLLSLQGERLEDTYIQLTTRGNA